MLRPVASDPHAPLPPRTIPTIADQRERAIMLLGCRSNGDELHAAKRDELIALVGAYPPPRIAARWKAWLKHRWPAWMQARSSITATSSPAPR
jgi:hypothetical protein